MLPGLDNDMYFHAHRSALEADIDQFLAGERAARGAAERRGVRWTRPAVRFVHWAGHVRIGHRPA